MSSSQVIRQALRSLNPATFTSLADCIYGRTITSISHTSGYRCDQDKCMPLPAFKKAARPSQFSSLTASTTCCRSALDAQASTQSREPTSHPPFTSPSRRHNTASSQAGGPSHPASTVNVREAKKFADLAAHWWDINGPFKPLHQLNPTRCRFMRDALCDHFGRDPSSPAPLDGLRLVDVGCGGGILSEALARMGAEVEGIDVNEEGINVAQRHAALDPAIAARITYRTTTIEQLAAAGAQYDAVVASEVIEHVDSVPAFCSALVQATRPGGALIVSTLNRSVRAYALAVVAAEHVLGIVPAGTHDWGKFVTPEELVAAMEGATGGPGAPVRVEQIAGMLFDPLAGKWRLGRDTGINYIAHFTKSL